MTANSSDGVVEADVMRQFLLQCADNYGSHPRPKSTMWTPGNEEEDNELPRSSSRIGLGSKLEELRRRERELELEEMLNALDLDRDGKVSLNDFIRLLILDQVEEDSGQTEGQEEGSKKTSKKAPSGEDANGRASSIDRKDTTVNIEAGEENVYQTRSRKGCLIM
jgi:hypothetical protein